MINVMHSVTKPMNQTEKSLDPQLWHACAGGMTQLPPENSKVFYFPQGHAEHSTKNVNFNGFSRIPPLIPCKVSYISYLADTDTDEVYAKIRLVPLRGNECDIDDEGGLFGVDKNGENEKTNSFAKTLTQSDANNGGGFSVPRYCAETIFPRLDYSANPPVQTVLVKDVHGDIWKFRHIYRGTPRRHLLTTGWSNFVNRKKLIAGDSIVFFRADNGDLCVGIRRANRGISGGSEVSNGWNVGPSSFLYPGLSSFLSENGKKGNGGCDNDKGNVRGESVIEAANLAALGEPFEVVYYPRASSPEFVVKASAFRTAMRVNWCAGMRFKMPFETEDSSRISWFMGTISGVCVEDSIHWPNSPWRLLQVAWDEPDLLQNVKRVNPWLVELVSNIPSLHLCRPFSPPRKRSRFPEPTEYPIGQIPMPTLLSNNNPLSPSSPLCCLHDSISAGIQGARHAQFSLPSSHFQFKKLHPFLREIPNFDSLSCSLKIESSTQELKKDNDPKAPKFRLFGQTILTEQQISQSYSVDTGGNSFSDGNQENTANVSNGSGSGVIQNFPLEASSDVEFPMYNDQKVEFDSVIHCSVNLGN
ncbi:hypothetical protein RD792_011583 [Penstemon davidsonii]|uniref:Auxin response factor n=1 Tax=Penstemon davidsonii TaxID=160366 RepID=A0ABR0CZT3_9LAMI|nr:hypothetical protein RD792_011583 [Penstemon davidsonii]